MTTTLSRSTTFITNLLGKPVWLFFGILILLSCEDTTGEIGIKNPARDFQIYVKEFSIPTSTFLVDSLSTSYGTTIYDGSALTAQPNRLMFGQKNDPNFGKTTAVAYTQYWAARGILFNTQYPPVFEKATLTLVLDNYWDGETTPSDNQLIEVHELADSILTYKPYYSNQTVAQGPKIGTINYTLNPGKLDQNVIDNNDLLDTGAPNTANDIIDSIFVNLDESFGRRLLAFAMDTTGTNKSNYGLFYKFRRVFKGLEVTAPGSKQVVGFDPSASHLDIYYRTDTVHRLVFPFSPTGQTYTSRPEFMGYSYVQTDRSGTPLAALPPKYVEWQPADGKRYVQAGEGIVCKIDFSEVADFFKDIKNKSLSVAELRIEADNQPTAPSSFTLRALKHNNRYRPTSIDTVNIAYDPLKVVDYNFVFKHVLMSNNYVGPNFFAQPGGDERANNGTRLPFSMKLASKTGPAVYTGYMTDFLQQEIYLQDQKDFLRYWALIPQTPDLVRGTNGFYFPADKIKLKVYYAAPKLAN